jgi:Xaa-Pro aminopeptidase
MVPGRPCSEPNRIALDTIRAAGAGDHILHRLGHGMGVAFHEPPWAEDGDPTPMQPGMVLSSEPAVYVQGLGGFRLADTVLLTEEGQECLTRFPRALEEIVIA